MIAKPLSQRWLGLFLMGAFLAGSFAALPMERLHAAPAMEQAAVELVNVNKATFEELQTVRGIGPALAGRIIEFREENGPFESVEDLASVRGIGGAKLQRIKTQTVV